MMLGKYRNSTLINSSTTVYSLIKPNSLWMELPILLSFNLLLIGSAWLSFNIPWSPVPITGQTLAVLLVAMTLGRIRGTAVVAAYVAEGAVGLPVFAGGATGITVLFGPTGGYLLGFVAATYFTGYLADKSWDRNFLKSIIAMTLGTAIIFICGLVQLSFFVPSEFILTSGLYPFIPGAMIKITIAFLLLPSVWKMTENGNNQR